LRKPSRPARRLKSSRAAGAYSGTDNWRTERLQIRGSPR